MTHGEHPRGRSSRVDVSGTGAATAAPDVVRVAVGVRCEADSVANALSQAARRVTEISAAAQSHGVAARDLASTSASVQPRWDREGTAIVGYTAYHQLAVTVRAIGDLNPLVDAIAAAAGDSLVIDNIALDIADRGPLAATARELAFADARDKAEQFARLSGATLGRVLHLVEADAGFGGGPPPGARYSMAADAGSGMPVQAGEHTVTATVRVTWSLVGDPSERSE
ncbi:MAG TPA: SIMPL domain-containing protein [Dermatophilaceae bacterium]|nr:SIMPL domain-containing protein [Dermatophilaceae bacterium]